MKSYAFIKKVLQCTLLFFGLFFLQWQLLFAQTVSKDSSHATASMSDMDKKNNSSATEDGELVLDVIEIKGYVDKPGVTIIPKRVEPEMEDMEIDRSFDREVKQGVGEIPMPDDALRQVDRVKSIKKAIDKKRK